MANTIYTKSTSSVTSNILNPFLIYETETTRRVLLATIVDNPKDANACISGEIVHQRKGKTENWENIDAISLSTLKAGEEVRMQFSCSQMKALKECLNMAYTIGSEGAKPSYKKFIIGTEEEIIIIKGREKEYINRLLSQNLGEDIWKELVDTNPDLATKLSLARIQSNRLEVVSSLESNLNTGKDELYWQKQLSENDWIFGYGLSYNFTTVIDEQVYVGGKNINNKQGQVVDFLSQSEGYAKFTVLIEIKKPNTQLLGNLDRNRCYPISEELSKAISQIQGYCETWGTKSEPREYFEKENKDVFTVKPRGIIVIGNSEELDTDDKKKSFELFRRNIHNPEIITYDELLARAKYIVGKNPQESQNFNYNNEESEIDDLPF